MIVYLRRNEGLLLLASPVIVILGAIIFSLSYDSFYGQFHDGSIVHSIANIQTKSFTRIVNGTISVLLSIAAMLYLNRLSSEESLLVKLSNLPLLSFAISIFLIPIAFQNITFWSSALLFILFLSQCLNCINERRVSSSVFNGAFLLGSISLLSSGYSIHLISLIGALLFAGELNLRRVMLAVIGFITPIYLLLSILYVFWPATLSLVMGQMNLNASGVSWSISVLSILFLVALNIGAAILQAKSLTIREKKTLRFEVFITIVSLLTLFLIPKGLVIGMVFIPFVILNARALINAKSKWTARLLFYIHLIVAAINIAFAW